jgi:flavodoxin
MKTLIVFYSRTGITKKVARTILKELKCDYEEILDIKSRKGILGYLKSGKEAATKKLPEIKKTKRDPSKYDLVIIGTPVWVGTMAGPIRTYISKNKFKKVAFFCTMQGSVSRTFDEMEKICGKIPVVTLDLKTKEVKEGNYQDRIEFFINKLK